MFAWTKIFAYSKTASAWDICFTKAEEKGKLSKYTDTLRIDVIITRVAVVTMRLHVKQGGKEYKEVVP